MKSSFDSSAGKTKKIAFHFTSFFECRIVLWKWLVPLFDKADLTASHTDRASSSSSANITAWNGRILEEVEVYVAAADGKGE